MSEQEVIKSWLRFDDVVCVRCREYCGVEGEDVWVVEGCVCDECITSAEKQRARPQS